MHAGDISNEETPARALWRKGGPLPGLPLAQSYFFSQRPCQDGLGIAHLTPTPILSSSPAYHLSVNLSPVYHLAIIYHLSINLLMIDQVFNLSFIYLYLSIYHPSIHLSSIIYQSITYQSINPSSLYPFIHHHLSFTVRLSIQSPCTVLLCMHPLLKLWIMASSPTMSTPGSPKGRPSSQCSSLCRALFCHWASSITLESSPIPFLCVSLCDIPQLRVCISLLLTLIAHSWGLWCPRGGQS